MYVYRKIQKKTRVTTKIFMKWIFSRDFNINFFLKLYLQNFQNYTRSGLQICGISFFWGVPAFDFCDIFRVKV